MQQRKKILITGKNSYIGNSFKNWISQWPEEYTVESISVRDNEWKTLDFSQYDTVLHTAGLAHVKENVNNIHLYTKVNRDLTFEVAKKAKKDGVSQFIFLSSMSVFGIEAGIINNRTPLKPKTQYGYSKLQAEELLSGLEEIKFRVAIVRPPMVYGNNCKGNYNKLSKVARRAPFFLNINNQRSMIYIDNLSNFLKYLIDIGAQGVYMPQNDKFVNTSVMVQLIAQEYGKELRLTKIFNPLIYILLIKVSWIKKVFGSLVYEKDTTSNYCIYNFEDSIKLSEEKRVYGRSD